MSRPRAVVTGGAGFLGSHLCERLLAEGYEVVCLDNFCTGTPGNVAHLLGTDHPFQLVHADVTEHVHVGGRVDAVLHFASPASPVDYLQLPIETLKVGSIGTMCALSLAREKGARFVLASTSEVYGDPRVHPQPETYWGHVNPVGPRGVYDEAKRFAEAVTVAYRGSHGVNTSIARIFNTHGPRMRPHDGRAAPTSVSPVESSAGNRRSHSSTVSNTPSNTFAGSPPFRRKSRAGRGGGQRGNCCPLPLEFLSDEQAAEFGRFTGGPSRAELDRCGVLSDTDVKLAKHKVLLPDVTVLARARPGRSWTSGPSRPTGCTPRLAAS